MGGPAFHLACERAEGRISVTAAQLSRSGARTRVVCLRRLASPSDMADDGLYRA
jgi:hypothetical protein